MKIDEPDDVSSAKSSSSPSVGAEDVDEADREGRRSGVRRRTLMEDDDEEATASVVASSANPSPRSAGEPQSVPGTTAVDDADKEKRRPKGEETEGLPSMLGREEDAEEEDDRGAADEEAEGRREVECDWSTRARAAESVKNNDIRAGLYGRGCSRLGSRRVSLDEDGCWREGKEASEDWVFG